MYYHQPQNKSELKEFLDIYADQAQFLAGGTDLLVESRQDHFKWPEHLIDISGIGEMKSINENENEISIGALTTHDEIVRSPLINKYAPLLAEACRQIGSQQIRNRGTIGGNICNASPCADTVPPLVALQAKVRLADAQNEWEVPIDDFFLKPYKPRLKNNEVVLSLKINKLSEDYRSIFYKLGRRNALAISRINMASVLKLSQEGLIEEARIAPGSVFPTWKRVSEAEEFLKGKKAELDVFMQAGDIVAGEMIKISGRRWSTPYKEPVVVALVKRVLSMAAGLEYF